MHLRWITHLGFSLLLLSQLGYSRELLFPSMPETSVTPGDLCDNPDEYRYPGQIPYCHRDVSTGRKEAIVERYDELFGYDIGEIGRRNFKIDHLIPLCMGGSNRDENLWPQHRTVYERTDPWEQDLCIKIANGEISHQEAVDAIYRVKFANW